MKKTHYVSLSLKTQEKLDGDTDNLKAYPCLHNFETFKDYSLSTLYLRLSQHFPNIYYCPNIA